MRWLRRLFRWTLILGFTGALLAAIAVGVAYWLIAPKLPTSAQIREVKLQLPLRVLSHDDRLIAEFGEMHRTPVKIGEIPERVKQAFIAAEDQRFYQHHGIDPVGIARAVWLLVTTEKDRVPGGSTITQQVARGFFLSNEYSYSRKLTEIFLALKLENELSKDEILELYLNKIFFGYRAYGVVAAADFYYGKPLDQLTVAEASMLASLPKFPSSGNPLSNPDRALQRRNYVVGRMREEGYIDDVAMKAAQAEPEHAAPHEPAVEVDAPHIAELVRIAAIERLGADAMTAGYVVHTTIDSKLQSAAIAALREGLHVYDRRHGWRGAESHIEPPAADADRKTLEAALSNFKAVGMLQSALVRSVSDGEAELYVAGGETAKIPLSDLAWARRYLSENSRGEAPKKVSQVMNPGDIVRLHRDDAGAWHLAQLPRAQSALVSLDPEDGALRAMVGGYSFTLSKFNRATQSNRQPGSSFKPFVYSAAFERGYTPASIVLDAPVVFPDPSKPDGFWRPANDDDKFDGPTRLREAMVQSKNLVSVRLLDAVGAHFTHDYVQRFGFPKDAVPDNLSMALGTASLPPLTMARAYATFANGGFRIDPYFIERIDDRDGKPVFLANPIRACRDCPERREADVKAINSSAEDLSLLLGNAAPSAPTPAPAAPTEVTAPAALLLAPRVLEPRNAWLITSLMQDVVKRGTGSGAMVLGRHDLAGKTGTTNEHRDGWFSGFTTRLVCSVWTGFDDYSPLGHGEFGAQVALPTWIGFMKVALDGVPEELPPVPAGITHARIDAATGQILDSVSGGMDEVFKVEDVQRLISQRNNPDNQQADPQQQTPDIF